MDNKGVIHGFIPEEGRKILYLDTSTTTTQDH